MPYHIQVTDKHEPRLLRIELDLNKEQVEERFAKPYLQGTSIFIDGRTIQAQDIDTIRVIETDETSKELAPVHERNEEQARARHDSNRGIGLPFAPSSLGWSIHKYGRNVTNSFIAGPMGSMAAPIKYAHKNKGDASDPLSVMVVHGRDENARKSLFAFLRAIGLKPMEWSQAVRLTGQGSPYIGDVLDAAFTKAKAAVILLTPDDEVRLHERFWKQSDDSSERELTPQARPNVLFEAGMAFGRYPERSIIVEMGQLRPFSDIAGRHVIRLNNSSEARKELAQRLESAGCKIDLTGDDWLSAGDFQVIRAGAGKDADAALTSDNSSGNAQNTNDILVQALQLATKFDSLADGYSWGKLGWYDIEPQRMALVRLKASLPYTAEYQDVRQAIDQFADAASTAFHIPCNRKKELEQALNNLTTRYTNLVAIIQGIMGPNLASGIELLLHETKNEQ